MTAQISDQLLFKERSYYICSVKGGKLFTPEEVGIKPIEISSACWRGYICKYTVENSFLELVELMVGEGNLGAIKVKHGKGKEILGMQPILHEEYHCAHYQNLDYKINFTGKLLIGDDFIWDLYVHIGYHPAYKYKEVYELNFDNGILLNIRDRSQEVADFRESNRDRYLNDF